MARLNKHQLTKEQTDKLFRQLSVSISRLSAGKADRFLSDLLGPEEKIMIAKRLGVIVLLLEGNSLYKISRVLKVSPATAERLKEKIERGDLDDLVAIIKKNQRDYLALLETVDSVLHLGGILPHYVGLDRYKSIRE